MSALGNFTAEIQERQHTHRTLRQHISPLSSNISGEVIVIYYKIIIYIRQPIVKDMTKFIVNNRTHRTSRQHESETPFNDSV